MPAGNELVISASSNQEAQDLFRYKIRLYRDNSVIQTLLYPPRPETGVKFDPSRFLQNELSFDIDKVALPLSSTGTPETIYRQAENTFVNYKVDFIEQYGADQQTYASAQVSGLIAINAALQWQQWLNVEIADYILANSPGDENLFLTNSPRTLKVALTERLALGGMTSVSSSTPGAMPVFLTVIRTYGNSGFIAEYTLENDPAIVTQANRFFYLLAGPQDINAAYAVQVGGTPIDSNVVYYTINVDNDNRDAPSEVFTFYIDDLCTRYITYRLHFLNRWGRIDSFTFKGDTDVLVDAPPNEPFTRTPGYADGNNWLYAATRHSMVNFATPYQDKWMLKADFVTVDEKAWLEELMTSPAVWWQAGAIGDSTTIWAVNIQRITGYKKEKHGLFSATFEMKLSTGSMAQNR